MDCGARANSAPAQAEPVARTSPTRSCRSSAAGALNLMAKWSLTAAAWRTRKVVICGRTSHHCRRRPGICFACRGTLLAKPRSARLSSTVRSPSKTRGSTHHRAPLEQLRLRGLGCFGKRRSRSELSSRACGHISVSSTAVEAVRRATPLQRAIVFARRGAGRAQGSFDTGMRIDSAATLLPERAPLSKRKAGYVSLDEMAVHVLSEATWGGLLTIVGATVKRSVARCARRNIVRAQRASPLMSAVAQLTVRVRRMPSDTRASLDPRRCTTTGRRGCSDKDDLLHHHRIGWNLPRPLGSTSPAARSVQKCTRAGLPLDAFVQFR